MSPASPERKPNPSRRWALMLVGVVVVFGGVFALKAMFAKKTNEFFNNMPQPAVAISADAARNERWADGGDAVGTLVAINGIDVTAESGGVVKSIEFDAGQPVQAGAVLVRLNSANEEASLKALEASAKLAKTQAERWQQLGKDKLVSLDDVQAKLTGAATAQAQVEAQRALIAQKTVYAPFSGVLGIRKVSLGQYIAPGAPVVSLQQLDPIYVDFTLPEQLIGTIKEGVMVRASIDAQPGAVFEGKISAIEPQVDPSTRNFKAQATLRNPDGLLRPGSFAKVAFDLGSMRDVVVIPQTAVSFNPYGNAVFVISKSARKAGETDMQGKPLTGDKFTVTQRFIKTGATRGDLITVTEGLKTGEQVVTSGLLKLRNGAEVTVNNAVTPTADAQPKVENR
ncbi:MAG: efflux RND transporter periplasmic adaptor subunit [Thermomonas sp.]|uniref:efflux RND transporter periplasmic adaptor subunit n=1 Tax=Thermomonas sp. TaxID=1971895 RepID=UPI001EBF2D9B|nr:efflux RND transporter periplasmic adaptor subunit [Thermomonas sp.]MBV2208720.1 efflux RND transporter periplasmic adaptor subunit [Thermomonas sp.]